MRESAETSTVYRTKLMYQEEHGGPTDIKWFDHRSLPTDRSSMAKVKAFCAMKGVKAISVQVHIIEFKELLLK